MMAANGTATSVPHWPSIKAILGLVSSKRPQLNQTLHLTTTYFFPAPKHCAETGAQAHAEGEGRRRVHHETPRLREQHGHGERTVSTCQDWELN